MLQTMDMLLVWKAMCYSCWSDQNGIFSFFWSIFIKFFSIFNWKLKNCWH